MSRHPLLAAAVLLGVCCTCVARPRVAIVSLEASEQAQAVASALAQALGGGQLFLGADAAQLARYLYPEQFDLVVLQSSELVPAALGGALEEFLARRGKLLALGGPPFSQPRWLSGGRWLTREEYLERATTPRPLLELAKLGPQAWRRGSNNPQAQTRWAVKGAAPDGSPALVLHIPQLSGWDTIYLDFPRSPFPAGHRFTCLWIRATGGPSMAALEWQERDGSRWIASVPVNEQWKRIFLPPEEFRFWRDSRAAGRGGQGDKFRPENAARFSVGLAQSHGALLGGPYTLEIAGVSSAPAPAGLREPAFPHLELLYPWYKHYTMRMVRAELVGPAQDRGKGRTVALAAELISPIARQRGLGLEHEPEGRFIPLVLARGADELSEGYLCSAFLSLEGKTAGACWGLIGLPAQRIVSSPWLLSALKRLSETMLQPVLLATGGTTQFNFLDTEQVVAGAEVIVRDVCAEQFSVRVAVCDEQGGATYAGRTFAFRPRWPRRQVVGRIVLAPGALRPGFYRCVCSLLRGGTVVDEISQPFTISASKPRAGAEFVRVERGDFIVGQRPWHPHGVNFWPGYVAGQEPGRYRGHWLRPMSYDPELVERDLQRLQRCGANLVSIQLLDLVMLPCARDFLLRCRRHGIRANIFIPGAHPLRPRPEQFLPLVRALAGDDAVFAWDLAWEPRVGGYERRRALDRDWERWLNSRYGSVAAAERDFRFPLPRDARGRVTAPSREQILNDGPWRIMVAAYRRFLDDAISKGYNTVVRALRKVDPNHLLGARTGYGGTGGMGADWQMPFDLAAGAKHLDFISPEGYNLTGPWEEFRSGGFTTAYARWAGNGKPVFWAEFGRSVHPQPDPRRIELQRELFENMYRMVVESRANGSAAWWFPGGFRVNENSDFGIFNPDGTPRPAALELKRFAPLVAAVRPVREPEVWIEVDRDAHPRGYSMVLARHREQYAQAVRAGKTVGVRTAGTGKTSANVPLVAVGNVPCTGENPPKYLNAEFNWLRLRADGGQWVEVRAGDTLRLRRGAAVYAWASLGNTGEAMWLSPASAQGEQGAVFLVAQVDGQQAGRRPAPRDVPRFADVEFAPFVVLPALNEGRTLRFFLRAEGRTRFGEAITLRVEPG